MIIKNAWIVEDHLKNYRNGAIVIEDDRIIDVGLTEDVMRKHGGAGHDIIDAHDKIVIPGLINSHTHISMTLLRGYADDLLLQEWLEKWIWPFEAKLTGKDIELGAILGSIESIRFGTTTAYTMYHYHSENNEASGMIKVGLRGNIGVAIFTWSKDKNIREFWDAMKKWHGKEDLIRVSLGPHAPYTVDPDTWNMLEEIRKEASSKYGRYGDVIISSHIAEDWNEINMVEDRFNVKVPGKSLFKYLEQFKVLSDKFLAAHAIHLNSTDVDIIKKYGVGIAHNPVANMKLGMGIADVPRLLENGIRVSLGTDGPASNNSLDMFETMKIAALIHKPMRRDPTILPANIVFRMATEYGALNLGYNDIGKIKPGYKADIVLIDRRKPNLIPVYDIYSHLVYSTRGCDVDMVIINGKIVYDGGFPNINVEEIYYKVEKRVNEIIEEVRGNEYN